MIKRLEMNICLIIVISKLNTKYKKTLIFKMMMIKINYKKKLKKSK